MKQILGEIKLFPYDDVPEGWISCKGQSLKINEHPKLYMMIGTKFGKEGDLIFKLPNLRDKAPEDMIYCIAVKGEIPKMNSNR